MKNLAPQVSWPSSIGSLITYKALKYVGINLLTSLIMVVTHLLIGFVMLTQLDQIGLIESNGFWTL